MHISIIKRLPGEKLRNGLSAEDRGPVAIGYAVDVVLQFLVLNNWQELLEGVTVSPAIEAVTVEVLDMGIPFEDFGEHPTLDLISVAGHILNELKNLLVLLGQDHHVDHRKIRVPRSFGHDCVVNVAQGLTGRVGN